MKQINYLFLASIMILSACTSTENTSTSNTSDETVGMVSPVTIDYSFVVMGCNRISWHDDKPAWDSSAFYNAAHTNIVQLNKTFDDAVNLTHTPDYFFFVGDLVLAENIDTNKLVDQLTAWKQLYHQHAISNSTIKMVAIPGNHEFLYSGPPNYNEKPNQYANEIWLRLMSDFIVGNNGPGVGGSDSLIYNESQLTYSINHKGDHFVLMNTDTYDEPGKVPVNWITNDISTWRGSNPSGHIFLLGHKPAYDANGMATGDTSDPGLAYDTNQVHVLWQNMNTNHCEAMLSAHEHLFWAGQPTSSPSWQIIAGNGGTTLDSGNHFGFTEVQVMSDGTVRAISHGRVVPTPLDYGAQTTPTLALDTFDLTW